MNLLIQQLLIQDWHRYGQPFWSVSVVIVIVISRSPEGGSLTHSARTPPAVHQGITIWVDKIEFEKK